MIRPRFVVLDRDGTILQERHYLADPDGVELVPGAAEGLRLLRQMDLGLVVVTNQSGINRGYFDRPRLDAIHQRMNELLAAQGVTLDGIYYCPHRPDEHCLCRKPRAGLLLRAARRHHFDPARCFVIGDKPCDIALGRRVGATTVLVCTGYGRQHAEDPFLGADAVCGDLLDAAQQIRARLTQEALGIRFRLERARVRSLCAPVVRSCGRDEIASADVPMTSAKVRHLEVLLSQRP